MIGDNNSRAVRIASVSLLIMVVMGSLSISPAVNFDNQITEDADAFALGGTLLGDSVADAYGTYKAVQDILGDWGDIDIQGQTDEQVAESIYENALADSGTYSNFISDEKAGLNRSDEVALSDAKIEIAQSLQTGEDKAKALKDARDALDTFYTREHQEAVIKTWNNQIIGNICSAKDVREDSVERDGSWDAQNVLRVDMSTAFHSFERDLSEIKNSTCMSGGTTEEYTLADNSIIDVRHIVIDDSTLGQGNISIVDNSPPYSDPGEDWSDVDENELTIEFNNPNIQGTNYQTLLDIKEMRDLLVQSNEKHQYAINNIGNTNTGFLNNVYQQYDSGDLENATDLMSAYDYHRQSTGQLNTTEWATLQLNSQDIPTNFSTVVTIEDEFNNSYTGEFYSKAQPPTGNWEINTTYGTNINDPVYVVGGGDVGYINSSTTFKITKVVKNGEEIQSFSSSDTGLSTATSTNLLNTINRQKEKLDYLEEEVRSSGFGSGGPLGGNNTLIIIGVILLLVVLYAMNNGGNNGVGNYQSRKR